MLQFSLSFCMPKPSRTYITGFLTPVDSKSWPFQPVDSVLSFDPTDPTPRPALSSSGTTGTAEPPTDPTTGVGRASTSAQRTGYRSIAPGNEARQPLRPPRFGRFGRRAVASAEWVFTSLRRSKRMTDGMVVRPEPGCGRAATGVLFRKGFGQCD